jgi:UDP-glucuronate 4-epimerase
VSELIAMIERELGKNAEKTMLGVQPGDVPATYADVDDLMREVGFRPSTSLGQGVRRFVSWYREFHGV